MARRRTPIRQWEADKARAMKLMDRLEKHVFASTEAEQMTPSQVTAAKVLLNKLLPDLKAIEHTGNPDRPVVTKIVRTIIDPAPTPDA